MLMIKMHTTKTLIVFVINRKQRRLLFNNKLGNVYNSTHNNSMLVSSMSKGVGKTLPLFQLGIHSLMSSSDSTLHPLDWIRLTSRSLGTLVAITVTTISHIHFTMVKRVIQTFISGNHTVSVFASREGTIAPDNITTLDRDGYLIPKGSMVKFVRVPNTAEWSRLLNFEISAINRDQTDTAIVTKVSVVPNKLKEAVSLVGHDRLHAVRTRSNVAIDSIIRQTHCRYVLRVVRQRPDATASLE